MKDISSHRKESKGGYISKLCFCTYLCDDVLNNLNQKHIAVSYKTEIDKILIWWWNVIALRKVLFEHAMTYFRYLIHFSFADYEVYSIQQVWLYLYLDIIFFSFKLSWVLPKERSVLHFTSKFCERLLGYSLVLLKLA